MISEFGLVQLFTFLNKISKKTGKNELGNIPKPYLLNSPPQKKVTSPNDFCLLGIHKMAFNVLDIN